LATQGCGTILVSGLCLTSDYYLRVIDFSVCTFPVLFADKV
jgi:hypothetical protein